MHLIQGFFVQGLPGLEIGYDAGVGERVLIRHNVASVMFAGTITVDEDGTPTGYLLDMFGKAVLGRIIFSKNRLEFVKIYEQNGRLSSDRICYDLRLTEGNRWSGIYWISSADGTFEGTVECIITEFDENLLEKGVARFAKLHNMTVVKGQESNESFADRIIDESRTTPLQS